MSHILDNPVWNALISSNSEMATGDDLVKLFAEDIAPFVGLKHFSEESFKALSDRLPPDRSAVIVTSWKAEIPASWNVVHQAVLLQMTREDPRQLPGNSTPIVPLKQEHIPQMIALTQLTNPGPFLERTIEFGNYTGIFKSDKLIAMAGQRMHVNHYIEISAVCTHPDHLGNGYGTALLQNQVNRILAAGNLPFLHVRKDNGTAIKLYEHLGFETRENMYLYVIKKRPNK
jgi:predicted GNAT family acetyltransferase